MPATDDVLTPAERLREIAAIFAAGILRLKTTQLAAQKTTQKTAPETAESGRNTAPVNTSESCRNPLDVSAKQSVHVTSC